MKTDRYAIVGFGCAGYHGAKSLRENGYTGEIHVYTDTAEGPENPMLTTYYAGGKVTGEAALPFGSLDDIARELDLILHAGQRVAAVDVKAKIVTAKDGKSDAYDKLLIATGATPFVPPTKGAGEAGVFTVRTMKDARRIRERIEKGITSAIVVGASMIGIKVVELVQNAGADCLLLDLAPTIFPLAALEATAEEIQRRLTEKGIEQKYGTAIDEISTEDTSSCGRLLATLTDGDTVQADMIVLCIGTRANVGLLNADDIGIDRGVLVDGHMHTGVPGVYAAGDCCQGREMQSGEAAVIGLWANAGAQGRTAGANMAGKSETYEGNILHNITHFMDMDFVGMGDNRLCGTKILYAPTGGPWLEWVEDEGKITCLNMLGDHKVCGIVKNMYMKRLRCGPFEPDEQQAAMLERYGVPAQLIETLGGAGR